MLKDIIIHQPNHLMSASDLVTVPKRGKCKKITISDLKKRKPWCRVIEVLDKDNYIVSLYVGCHAE